MEQLGASRIEVAKDGGAGAGMGGRKEKVRVRGKE